MRLSLLCCLLLGFAVLWGEGSGVNDKIALLALADLTT